MPLVRLVWKQPATVLVQMLEDDDNAIWALDSQVKSCLKMLRRYRSEIDDPDSRPEVSGAELVRWKKTTRAAVKAVVKLADCFVVERWDDIRQAYIAQLDSGDFVQEYGEWSLRPEAERWVEKNVNDDVAQWQNEIAWLEKETVRLIRQGDVWTGTALLAALYENVDRLYFVEAGDLMVFEPAWDKCEPLRKKAGKLFRQTVGMLCTFL